MTRRQAHRFGVADKRNRIKEYSGPKSKGRFYHLIQISHLLAHRFRTILRRSVMDQQAHPQRLMMKQNTRKQ